MKSAGITACTEKINDIQIAEVPVMVLVVAQQGSYQ